MALGREDIISYVTVVGVPLPVQSRMTVSQQLDHPYACPGHLERPGRL